MKKKLLELLLCPRCRNDLSLNAVREAFGEIETGNLVCTECRTIYPIVRFIPRFVHSDKYTESFSYEWQSYPKLQYGKESERVFKMKTGVDLRELKDKLVLDVGCGSGRFLDVVSRSGAEAVGFDMSYSVDEAFRNIGLRRNVHLIQADILNSPIRDQSFDLVYSIGVLHHTSDTKLSFLTLPRLLKRGGTVAVWVYVKWQQIGDPYVHVSESTTKLYRKFSTRLPRKILHLLCYAAVAHYHFKRLPVLGRFLGLVLVTSEHPDWRWRVLDTLDWYSPKYQFRHTNGEVLEWFKEAGLENVRALSFPVSVTGRRA